jgi:hypothetical protein
VLAGKRGKRAILFASPVFTIGVTKVKAKRFFAPLAHLHTAAAEENVKLQAA